VEEITFPEGTVNLLLLGSDEAPHRYGHRTDTIMILSLHPAQNRASLVSVPRDLYVYVPGWRMDRINVADIFGGDNMVHDTILYNLGVDIDHWVRINFTGFQTAVDLVGGIEVEVGRSLSDDCGGTHYVYSPGTYHMDGFTALCYVRMRKTSSDFDRLRRQQEVIRALFRKVVSLDGIARLPQLYEQFNTYVDGDIGVGDLLPLAPLASEIASGKAEFEAARIDQSLVTPWRVPGSGAAVLLPNRQMIQEMLQNVLGAE
jgi:LCP family protein required for cell wall assembly